MNELILLMSFVIIAVSSLVVVMILIPAWCFAVAALPPAVMVMQIFMGTSPFVVVSAPTPAFLMASALST